MVAICNAAISQDKIKEKTLQGKIAPTKIHLFQTFNI